MAAKGQTLASASLHTYGFGASRSVRGVHGFKFLFARAVDAWHDQACLAHQYCQLAAVMRLVADEAGNSLGYGPVEPAKHQAPFLQRSLCPLGLHGRDRRFARSAVSVSDARDGGRRFVRRRVAPFADDF